MYKLIIILAITMIVKYSYSQTLTNEEQKLYDNIMEYRKSKGLDNIPLSKSLTFVAQTHVKDLVDNHTDVGKCNLHSWSNKGTWEACCYTDDHANAAGMWSKPKEITTYSGNGYEIAHWASYETDADNALKGWKKSSGHNAVILNQGIWNQKWNAIGIGLYKNYAVIWFGNEEDK